MRSECINAVQQAIGRSITQQEAQEIQEKIRNGMKQAEYQDQASWRQLTANERLKAGADVAAAELLADAAKKKQRVALTIMAHDKIMSRYGALVANGVRPFRAISKMLTNADSYAKGVSNEYFRGLLDTLKAVDSKYLGMVEDAQQARDLVFEVYGRDTGNPLAKKGAKAWLDTIEATRTRFNANGGDIGKLDYAYLPQPHDALRVLKAGQQKWVDDILPLLDRSRYLDGNGRQSSDDVVREMLSHAWNTITTGGDANIIPGQLKFGSSRANSGSDHRVLHFDGPDSYLQYGSQYNKGSILSAMQGHVGKLSKDIAMVETFGPNPSNQFEFLHDTAKVAGDTDLVGPYRVTTKNMWDVLNGNTGNVVNVKMANFFQGWRNVEVFGKLQGAMISSITDIPTYFYTTGFNKIGFSDALINLTRSFGSESRDYANRVGMIADSLSSDMNRLAESNIGNGVTAQLANATMKASLLSAWTDAVRRAYSLSMMGALGKISRQDYASLHPSDRARLDGQGVTEKDFNIWKMSTPDDFKGSKMLSVDNIHAIDDAQLQAAGLTPKDRQQAASRLLGVIADESEYASVGQDLNTRAAVTRGTQKGTVEGEFFRSIMLFKGFPLAMISRHWGRVADTWITGDKASAVAYGAGLTTALTMFGAIALEMKDIIFGKDPRKMDTAQFWAAAFAQGGGVGILGDILYTGGGGNSRTGKPNYFNFAGPVVGDIAEAIDLTIGNASEAAHGKDTKAGAEAVRFARSHLPFINLWYAKSAIDHAGLQDLQEYLSPGYNARLKQTAEKDWHQKYYWQPGKDTPDRAPRF